MVGFLLGAPILDPGRGRTKTGYLWALARDDRATTPLDTPLIPHSFDGTPGW